MTKEKIKLNSIEENLTDSDNNCNLILFNDEIHTFDYVIDVLMEICHHTNIQATQCTIITHFKGNCDIKKGTYKELIPLRNALVNKELNAIINQ
jgi:ATP-dependent Clp protease adaptor protein ClpS